MTKLEVGKSYRLKTDLKEGFSKFVDWYKSFYIS